MGKLLFMLALLNPIQASAFCFEPNPPSPPEAPSTFLLPDAPFCLSGYKYSGTHTCDDWEIDRYLGDIDEYIDRLNSYVSEAEGYAVRASHFYEEAYRFAQCSAAEAMEPIE